MSASPACCLVLLPSLPLSFPPFVVRSFVLPSGHCVGGLSLRLTVSLPFYLLSFHLFALMFTPLCLSDDLSICLSVFLSLYILNATPLSPSHTPPFCLLPLLSIHPLSLLPRLPFLSLPLSDFALLSFSPYLPVNISFNFYGILSFCLSYYLSFCCIYPAIFLAVSLSRSQCE